MCGRETGKVTSGRRREGLDEKTRANGSRRRRTAHKLVACVPTSGTSSRKRRETFSRSPCSNVRPQVIYSLSN